MARFSPLAVAGDVADNPWHSGPSGPVSVRERPAAYETAAAEDRPGAVEPTGATSQAERASGPEHEEVGPEDAEVPDPFDDAEALDELGHEITTLAAHIAAATHRFLVLLADFDRRRGWELGGHRSCAHWLHVATAMDLRTARSRVRVARKLEGLPRTSEAMSRGELSFSQVRALSRVATPECEAELIEYARSTTVSELERFVRMWRTLSRADEASLERECYRLRRFSVVPDGEGMYVVRGRVTAEVGAALMRAIDAAGDALFCAEAKEETTPKQRRADALGLVAERALAVGFGDLGDGSREPRHEGESGSHEPGAERNGTKPEPGSREPHAEPEAESHEPGSREPRGRMDEEAGGASAEEESPENTSTPVPISGSRAERFQVMLHVKAEGTHLEDGTGVPRGTSRRLCCDSGVVTVSRGEDGSVLDVGRRTRTIPPALRRALEVRDNGCRFPGCGLRFTDGHHLEHWQDGGETKLDNLVLLCRYHHRLVHEGGWRVEFWGRDQHAAFIDPRGGIHMDTEWKGSANELPAAGDRGPERLELANTRPTPDLPENAVDALVAENEARKIRPTGWALWAEHGRATDVPWTTRARALEALDAAHFGV